MVECVHISLTRHTVQVSSFTCERCHVVTYTCNTPRLFDVSSLDGKHDANNETINNR